MAKESPATVSIDTIARLLMLTPRRVQQLANEKVIPRIGRGRYEMVPAVQGYIRYLKERAEGGAESIDLASERSRLAKERADALHLKNAKARGELVPPDATDRTVIALATVVSGRLQTIGTRLAPALAAAKTLSACQEIVDEALAQALLELSESAGEASLRVAGGASR